MALVKRPYTDGETVITAENLNAIQDEIIANGNNKADKTAAVSTVTYSTTNHSMTKTINGTTTTVFTLGNIVDLGVVEVTS